MRLSLKMPPTLRRNAVASAAVTAAAAWLAVSVGTSPHFCLAHSNIGVGLDAAAGSFQWNWTVFWTLDPPPRADFLPEDEDLIRVARPAAKPAVHKPTGITRRILWLTPEDGRSQAETNPAGGTVEKTIVSDRAHQDWLGIPGPPSGNQESGGKVPRDVAGERSVASLKRSKSLPQQHQSHGISGGGRKERNSKDTLEADASQNWSPTGGGTKSATQFTVDKLPETQIDPSATSKMGREAKESYTAIHKEVQGSVLSQEKGARRRLRSQLHNRLGYAVRDGSENADNTRKKIINPPTLQTTKKTNNFFGVSRTLQDEDQLLNKKIRGQRRLLWFQEGHYEKRRTSFQYREARNSNTASGTSGNSINLLNQYGNTISVAKEKLRLSNLGHLEVLRRPIEPGQWSPLNVDPLVYHSDEGRQRHIKMLLANISEVPRDVEEKTERKLLDSPALDGTVTSPATRRIRSPSWAIDSLDKSQPRGKIGEGTVLKQEDFTKMTGTVILPADTVSKSSQRADRSLDGSSIAAQDDQDGPATPDDADQTAGQQTRIGRRLLEIPPNGVAPPPAEDTGAAGDGDGEMTREEEAAVRERLVHDVVGDLLAVDGSGDGSGWGELET